MIHVVARMEIKEGQLESFLALLQDLVPTVRAEDGCIRYEVCLDAKVAIGAPPNPQALTILETWESPEHLAAHLASPHMAAFRNAAAGRRENATVTVLDPKL
ncbi:MAG: antibiotic biosynthesis monooxygenase [Oligosphaeraceae bacterium]|nr:antibiotic biosynthesis monooxygenase [Oligosphaeraceae bacterium]